MLYLFLVSLLWAFSFGLIKGGLTGLPPAAVAFLRLLIAFAVFAPFLRIRNLRPSDAAKLLLTGAVQYGLMYITYIQAFQHLQAYEVALFTVFTPIYVTILNDLFKQRFNPASLTAVVLAVAGGIVTWSGPRSGYGNMVEINHGNGYVTRYAHNEQNLVAPGDRIQQGQNIALMGSSGRATGPHLHFEVWHRGRPVNPVKYVRQTT